MEVNMQIEGTSKVLQKGDSATPRRLARFGGRPLELLELRREDAQQLRFEIRIGRHPCVQVHRKREHPLSQRHVRQHVLHQICCRLRGAARGTAGTEAALAAEGHEVLLGALRTAHPDEALRQHPAVEVPAQRPADVARRVLGREKGLDVFADHLVQEGLFGLPPLVGGWRADSGRL